VVSTANNHALDRGALGVDRTLAALDAAKLRHTGTRARGTETPWHTTTTAGGMTIAWLACTLHTNRIADEAGQVLRCFDSKTAVADMVTALARTPGIDAVIVTPHWGKEYEGTPSKQQREFARRWAEAGATAIIGSHPHVLQPWEKLETSDGREVLVVYSLGNFVSHQPELEKRSTAIVYVGLGRAESGPVFVYGAGYVPVHVRQSGEEFFAEAIDRVGGPADARAHVVGVFGAANVLAPNTPIEVAPQCFPAPDGKR
ncbi:MAG TPA: CapA family protein, partial [Nannocystis sp.]